MALAPPEAVIAATREYRKDSDKIMRFAEECLIPDRGGELRTAFLYEEYKDWCISNGVCSESSQRFKQGLERIGFEIVRARPKNSPGSTTTLIRGYKLFDEQAMAS